MPDRTDQKAHVVNNGANWYEELGLIARFPRPPVEEITDLLRDIAEPKISLRDNVRNVEIVVQFPLGSKPHLSQMRASLAKSGLTLSEAFDAVLWKKLDTNSTWAELAGPAIEAYRQTWLHFFRLVYLGHFHPLADAWLKKIVQEMASNLRAGRKGRRPQTKAERASLRKRYNALLTTCRLLHSAVADAVESLGKNVESGAATEIRRAAWDKVKRHIHGTPGDGYIFAGEAYTRIPYGHGTSKLHDPQSWKPHQLAISLLSFERVQAYQTIEKKIVPTKRKNRRRL